MKNLEYLASVVGQVGVSAAEATQALNNLFQLLRGNAEIDKSMEEIKVTMKANYEEKTQKQKINGNLNMSLYDLNKAAIPSLPDYTEKELEIAKTIIEDYVKTDKFFMLLGRDLNYYTMFMREPLMTETIGEAVIDCLKNIGSIKSIDKTDDNAAIEIWIMANEEPHVLYFFCYNEGVIVCR